MKRKNMLWLYSYRVTWEHADYTNPVSGIVSFTHISDYITSEIAKSLITKKLIDNHGNKVTRVGYYELLWCEEYYEEFCEG